MARLTAAARRPLPLSDFAVPSKAPGPGSYPMPDKAHAAVAKGRAKEFGSPAVKAKVDAKANRKLGKGRSERVPVGFGSLSHRNKPINAPNSLSGRRNEAHAKAYRD